MAKQILKTLVLLGLTAGLLAFAFQGMDPRSLWDGMRKANPGLVVLSIALGYVAVIFRAYRWRIVLRSLGHPVAASAAVHAVALSYLVNLVIPRGGEVARCTAIQQAEGVPVDKALGTVVMERIIDLVMALALVSLVLFLNWTELQALPDAVSEFGRVNQASAPEASSPSTPAEATFPWWGWALGIAALAAAGAFWARRKWGWDALKKRAMNFAYGLLDGLRSVARLDNARGFWAHTVAIWVCYFLMVYLMFFALPATSGITLAHALFVMMSATFSYIVPAPGGFGTYHVFVTSALWVTGVPMADGLIFATVVHSAQTAMMLLAGTAGFAGLAFLRKRHGQG
jgi:uncharacterized membrane protein YbhN (UPF0104 family)